MIGSATIGAEASVWPGAVIRADDGPITIGARTSIQDGTVLHTTAILPTTIGAECVVGHIVHLEGCIIEDGALVGNGSVVLVSKPKSLELDLGESGRVMTLGE